MEIASPNSMIAQLRFLKEDDDMLYTSMYLRCQVIRHFLHNFEEFFDEISEDIKYEYGRIDSEVGPFSCRTWCEYILEDKNYCDSIFIKLVASMWGIRITIVRTDNCAELKFRHNFKLDDVDMSLLYNGAPSQGHYNALIKVGKELSTYKLNCKEVKRSNNYDPNLDVLERLERKDVIGGSLSQLIVPDPPPPSEESVTITKKEYENLIEKSRQLDMIMKVLGGQSMNVSSAGGAGDGKRKVADEGQGSQKGQKKRRVEGQFEGTEEVKDVEVGDVECDICNLPFKTTKTLRSHNAKVHARSLVSMFRVWEGVDVKRRH